MATGKVSMMKRIALMFLALGATAPAALPPAILVIAAPALAAAQTAQPCVEDFTSDTDPTMPGFAGSVFSHSITGSYSFFNSSSGYDLAMFAGATDVVTFPGQSVTYAKVSFFSYSSGYIIFEGAGGNTLTYLFNPVPLPQTREASDTTAGDNGLALGQIQKVTLIGFETVFDSIEIGPCMSAPPPAAMVDVLIRPRAINPRRHQGLVKAVILSNASFDATTVDPATVQFGAATVPFRYFLGDEDEDGDTDLIFFFLAGDIGIACGDTTVRLTGQTVTGQLIEGAGPIETRGCP